VNRWVWWILIAAAAVLFWWGWFVLGFLGEPSAVDRVRVALIVIGGGSVAVAIACSAAAAWMLFARRTQSRT
jgi:hypothetical protein